MFSDRARVDCQFRCCDCVCSPRWITHRLVLGGLSVVVVLEERRGDEERGEVEEIRGEVEERREEVEERREEVEERKGGMEPVSGLYGERRGGMEPVGGSYMEKKCCRAVFIVVDVRMLSDIVVVEERRG
jgi:hypothetical protein